MFFSTYFQSYVIIHTVLLSIKLVTGILYESCNQPRDAYACYVNASRGAESGNNNNNVTVANANTNTATQVTPRSTGAGTGGMNPNLSQRIKFLQTHLGNAPMPSITSK